MTDAAAHFKKVLDALLDHKFTNLRVILGMFGRRRGDGMIQGDRHPFGGNHPCAAKFKPDLANGRGVIMAEHHVGAGIDYLAHGHTV